MAACYGKTVTPNRSCVSICVTKIFGHGWGYDQPVKKFPLISFDYQVKGFWVSYCVDQQSAISLEQEGIRSSNLVCGRSMLTCITDMHGDLKGQGLKVIV